MAICNIAGLTVDIKNIKGRTKKQAAPYFCEDQSESKPADITIDVTPERVKAAMAEHPELNNDDWEYMLTGSDFYTELIDFNGILLHSSCVAVDGIASLVVRVPRRQRLSFFRAQRNRQIHTHAALAEAFRRSCSHSK